jgi:hypothetical protein
MNPNKFGTPMCLHAKSQRAPKFSHTPTCVAGRSGIKFGGQWLAVECSNCASKSTRRKDLDHQERLMQYSKEELIGFLEDAAKNWLAHDGLW